jgi:hypothetical protein
MVMPAMGIKIHARMILSLELLKNDINVILSLWVFFLNVSGG